MEDVVRETISDILKHKRGELVQDSVADGSPESPLIKKIDDLLEIFF